MQDDTLKARGWIESKAMRAEFDADLGDARRTQRARRAGSPLARRQRKGE